MIATACAAILGMSTLGNAEDLHLGQTVGFTGPQAGNVKELTDGAKLWIDAVNAKGGINGQKIILDSIDDGYDPKVAGENAKKLINSGVLALFLSRGTQLVEPLADQVSVAVVAPSSGAMIMHNPVKRVVFNVRSKFQAEAERAIKHLSIVGLTRIGVVYVDDTFGKDGLAGADRGLQEANINPTWKLAYDRTTPKFAPIIETIIKSNVQAVLVIATGAQASDLIAGARAAGSVTQFITLSNNSSKSFVKSLGENARGVMVTQVFPNPRRSSHAFLVEFQKLARDAGVELSYTAVEGFVSAKVMVEGLRRAASKGPVTRPKLIEALNSIRNYDVGGLQLSYSPTDHTGFDYVEISIINAKGEFLE